MKSLVRVYDLGNYKNMKQRGNVLFLILIAVALFAALSYAVTQSSNPAGNNASKEQADLIAAQIVQSAAGIKFAYDRLNISGRYDQIHFDDSADNPAGTVYNGTASPGTGRTIGIFNPINGLAPPNIPEAAYSSTFGLANAAFLYVPAEVDSDANGTAENDVGTNEVDVLLRYAVLTEGVCSSINRRLKGDEAIPVFSTPTAAASTFTSLDYNLSTGTFSVSSNAFTLFLTELPVCAQLDVGPTNIQFFYAIDVK